MYDKLGIQAITGISFSPAPEAQHMPKWVGALVNCPNSSGLLFLFFGSLFEDLRGHPLG